MSSTPRHRAQVIAHHLIFTGYGFWLPNDLRGSGSTDVRKPDLQPLGPAHFGRRPDHEQPTRDQLRQFFRDAEPRLAHPLIWFDAAKRQALSEALSDAIHATAYTCWACAVLSNHVHLLIRRHRDRAERMWQYLAEHMAQALRALDDVPADHPIWASRPYHVFCHTPDRVRTCAAYIDRNPQKENLPPQSHPFVQPYNDWPFHLR